MFLGDKKGWIISLLIIGFSNNFGMKKHDKKESWNSEIFTIAERVGQSYDSINNLSNINGDDIKKVMVLESTSYCKEGYKALLSDGDFITAVKDHKGKVECIRTCRKEDEVRFTIPLENGWFVRLAEHSKQQAFKNQAKN